MTGIFKTFAWAVMITGFSLVEAPSQALDFSKPLTSPAIALEESPCDPALKGKIDQLLAEPQWQHSQWALVIQTLGQNQSLYGHHGDRLMIPASGVKLFTTAAALDRWGANYRYETVVTNGGITEQKDSHLYLYTVSDPTLTQDSLENLAQQLAAQGLQTVDHAQVVLQSPGYGVASWEWGDLPFYYATEINSAILDENTVTLTLHPTAPGALVRPHWSDAIAGQQWTLKNQALTTAPGTPLTTALEGELFTPNLQLSGAIALDANPDHWRLAIPQPEKYLLDHWVNHLAQADISVDHAAIEFATNLPPIAEQTILATERSPSLLEIITVTNQNSSNLHGEALNFALNGYRPGTQALENYLLSLGGDRSQLRLVDGSGLSRHNQVTPQAMVDFLQAIAQKPWFSQFLQSLSVAGESGTLRRRLASPGLRGQIYGKTGTMSGIVSFSGYLFPPERSPLAVSVMVNYGPSVAAMREVIDEILTFTMDACDRP